jgi:hypothetical protein
MSRSGYSEDIDDNWSLICWRGAVASAIRGKRGQALLREAIAALDALPAPRLTRAELEANGEVCFLGAVGRTRGIDMTTLNPEDLASVTAAFDISGALAREIFWENDETQRQETPEERFDRMRRWAESNLRNPQQEMAR